MLRLSNKEAGRIKQGEEAGKGRKVRLMRYSSKEAMVRRRKIVGSHHPERISLHWSVLR